MIEELEPTNDHRYDDRYSVAYSVYGKALDPDGLVAAHPPGRQYELWHAGDVRGGTRRSVTSGIRIDLVEAAMPADAAKAIEAFVIAEKAFLQAAARCVQDEGWSAITCAMFVYAKVPSTMSLPATLLSLLGESGVEWAVTGYPCADDDGP